MKGYEYHYYDCGGKKRAHTCGARSPRAEAIEKAVIDAIYAEVLSPEAAETFADKAVSYMADLNKKIPRELSELRTLLREAEHGIDNIVQAVVNGMASPALSAKMAELEERKEQYQARIHEAEFRAAAATASRDDILRYLSSFGDIRTASPAEQRRAVEVFVDRIIVTDGKADIYILSPAGKKNVAHDVGAGLSAPTRREIVMIISCVFAQKSSPR